MENIEIVLKDFIEYGVNLQTIGVNNFAWNYANIIKIINNLYNRNFITLGGDVYLILENEEIELTYNNWYISKDDLEKGVTFTKNKSIKCIEKFNNVNKMYYYDVVIEKSI